MSNNVVTLADSLSEKFTVVNKNEIETEILEELIGKTINHISLHEDNESDPDIQIKDIERYDQICRIGFYFDNMGIRFYHSQDCCEYVRVGEIIGDLNDLIGEPLLEAESVSYQADVDYGDEQWTFYKFSTIKGSVVIRWLGESNGYYSTNIDYNVYDFDMRRSDIFKSWYDDDQSNVNRENTKELREIVGREFDSIKIMDLNGEETTLQNNAKYILFTDTKTGYSVALGSMVDDGIYLCEVAIKNEPNDLELLTRGVITEATGLIKSSVDNLEGFIIETSKFKSFIAFKKEKDLDVKVKEIVIE